MAAWHGGWEFLYWRQFCTLGIHWLTLDKKKKKPQIMQLKNLVKFSGACFGNFWIFPMHCIYLYQFEVPCFISTEEKDVLAGIILCMSSANETWRYTVTPSLIGWVHTHNDPCIPGLCAVLYHIQHISYFWSKKKKYIYIYKNIP